MSLKTIFDIIHGQLPTSPVNLQSVFLFGARKLPQHAGPVRIVFVPTTDAYQGGRARQSGKPDTQGTPEIYNYEATVEIHLEAPTHLDIDQPHGLRDLIVSICQSCFPGSFRPLAGEWDLENNAAQQVRGEHYTLRVIFGRPVVATDNANALINDYTVDTEIPP